MKKKMGLLGVLLLVIIAASGLLGARSMSEEEKVDAVRLALETVKDYEYKGVSSVYEGHFVFAGDGYQYIVPSDKIYVKYIESQDVNAEIPEVTVAKDEIEKLAVSWFLKIYPEVSAENLYTEVRDYNGATFLVTIGESISNVPTGREASFDFLGDGSLYAGVFLEPTDTVEVSAVTSRVRDIGEVDIAVEAINEALAMHYTGYPTVTKDMLQETTSVLKNFKGDLYYLVETKVNLSVINKNGVKETYIESYQIRIDADTGECTELSNTSSTGFVR